MAILKNIANGVKNGNNEIAVAEMLSGLRQTKLDTAKAKNMSINKGICIRCPSSSFETKAPTVAYNVA